jgi:predicted Rossmann-fold nucleotide-binding protein
MKTTRKNVVQVTPAGGLEVLSQQEVASLRKAGHGGIYDLFRQCSLAVVNSDNRKDDTKEILAEHKNFDIRVVQQDRGIKLEVHNAPADAFVDDTMIEGIRELLFDVLRDIVYVNTQINQNQFDLGSSEGITNAVFSILRNANLMTAGQDPNLVVCWGGHSIQRFEYEYTKRVGYQLGLRGLDICTGCGPGAMKGPMKGAAIAHRKQRIYGGRYVGISEPGIIAAESPNPIVNQLVILPDIEKRLEAFVRLGHGIIVFPGGVGTAEEILYMLGILLHPDNQEIPFPFIFTGPRESEAYFQQIDDFIGHALGEEAQNCYEIIIDDPVMVSRRLTEGMQAVRAHRKKVHDAFFFNWSLHIQPALQHPFIPTHEAMAALEIHPDQQPHLLAANLRRAFSGIVAGNVKEDGLRRIQEFGKFHIHGDPGIMARLDALLSAFVEQKRMKLPGTHYVPCYEVSA